MDEPLLSIVAPCYNEEAVLPEFYQRVTAVCRDLDLPYELVLVNDGSRDGTWEQMRGLAQTDPNVVSVNLARNHGHQLALSAGLSVCRGQRILIIDADLQDPPELLPAMLQRMDEGVDVVYGQRRMRRGESWFKRITSTLFYRVINGLSSVPIAVDTGDFRLISRRVLDVLLAMPERHRFMRGMVSWVGYRQEPILYDRDARFAGETKYPLRKMWKLAVDGITSFSTRPLQWSATAGFLVAFVGLILLGIGVGRWFDGTMILAGWLTCLAGTHLISQGILGAYVGRISEQGKGRPLFLIERIERYQSQYDDVPVEHTSKLRVRSLSA